VGAQLFHAEGQKDRQTGMSKPIVAFRSFTNTTKLDVPKPNVCCLLKAQSSLLTNLKFQGIITPWNSAQRQWVYFSWVGTRNVLWWEVIQSASATICTRNITLAPLTEGSVLSFNKESAQCSSAALQVSISFQLSCYSEGCFIGLRRTDW